MEGGRGEGRERGEGGRERERYNNLHEGNSCVVYYIVYSIKQQLIQTINFQP